MINKGTTLALKKIKLPNSTTCILSSSSLLLKSRNHDQQKSMVRNYSKAPAVITAALTGDVPTKNRHMNVPITPEEIVQDACEVFEAGARMIHVHVRDDEGKPTCKAEYYERVLDGVRRDCPEMIVQFSTGNYWPNLEERIKCFRLEKKPEMGSWTPGSVNFLPSRKGTDIYWNTNEDIEQIIKVFKENGVRPDVALFDVSMLYRTHMLYKLGWIQAPVRLMFVFGGYMSLPGRPSLIKFLISECDSLFGPENYTWTGVGVGWNHTEFQKITLENNGHPRTGFEDTFLIKRKVIAKSNKQLVAHLADLCAEHERPVATVEQARKILGLDIPVNTNIEGLMLPTESKSSTNLGWNRNTNGVDEYYQKSV